MARRAQEVRFAEFQDQAAAAAREGDWSKVEAILKLARKAAAGNEWLAASLGSLERYASLREREMFSKEARFKSSRMRTRLADLDEGAAYSMGAEYSRASFLRRKREEGKGASSS